MSIKIFKKLGGSFEPPVITHKFTINKNLKWLSIELKYDKKSRFGLILWDSNKKIRAQILCTKSPIVIVIDESGKQSSASTLPGPIVQGEWTIETFKFLPELNCNINEDINYEIDINLGTDDINLEGTIPLGENIWTLYSDNTSFLSVNTYEWNKRKKEGLRWYKGDFHTHTTISDGKMTPKMNINQAKIMEMDFFVSTDHNILSTGWVEGDVLVIPGMEITSQKGHFNALGINKWIDFRLNTPDGGLSTDSGMNRLMTETKGAGGLCSINHSMMTPWAWTYKETLLENIDTLEIICDPSYETSNQATEDVLDIWTKLWNDGYRIWGIGGSDSHLLAHETYIEEGEPSLIGDPGTFVLAEGLSASEIIKGVSLGRIYVSRGPKLDVKVKLEDKSFNVGGNLTKLFENSEEKTVEYVIDLSNVKDELNIIFIENGKRVYSKTITEDNIITYAFKWKDTEYSWLRADIRNKEGKLVGFINPIYKGYKNKNLKTWKDLLEFDGGHNFE
ncbi:CehA/McbA family metallohydrolase [Clostridium sp. P21]|uniref:CehA/McbA family metallohydrolase n=1 Tax=Clostridium muellerianum TaxID=2716538 RepID=A0A7Y0EKK3_9CLOT|nr:CehA/McbA family metallohydrolase [Clostridium muellerianum]NMM65199.1 CehA/McbA family metallohydrolase [Clostridium muellerianum]